MSETLTRELANIENEFREAKQLKLSDFQHTPNSFLDSLEWNELDELPRQNFTGLIITIQYFPSSRRVYMDFAD